MLPWYKESRRTLELRANFFNIFNQLNLDAFSFHDTARIPTIRFSGSRLRRSLAGVVEFQARFSSEEDA